MSLRVVSILPSLEVILPAFLHALSKLKGDPAECAQE